jgi:hypothetical protein
MNTKNIFKKLSTLLLLIVIKSNLFGQGPISQVEVDNQTNEYVMFIAKFSDAFSCQTIMSNTHAKLINPNTIDYINLDLFDGSLVAEISVVHGNNLLPSNTATPN